MHDAVKQGKPYEITCRIFTLDGELRYIHTRGKSFKGPLGQAGKLIGTMQDTTPQKVLESELRKRNRVLRDQFETDRLTERIRNVGSWQWDVKTGKLVWTEKMFQLFGLKPYSFDPTLQAFLDLMHPLDSDRLKNEFEGMKEMNQGPLPDYEFRVMVQGLWRHMRASARMMNDGFVIGNTIDITQDALLRQELSEKVKQLQEVNEELTSFAFVASHDLREPLRKIQIFSDWLCQKETASLSPEGLDRFKRIQVAVARMETLIDGILSFSRINIVEKHFREFDLNQVMESAKSDLQETINKTQAVIESDHLPSIKGNRSQFEQLFQNLLGNALKYHKPDAPPHIRITSTEVDGAHLLHLGGEEHIHYLKISITDSGIGFDPQYTKKIFQMFQRLHGMHEYPGTGMGLAICKKILEYHGGFITGRGDLGTGAVFDCYIPIPPHIKAAPVTP